MNAVRDIKAREWWVIVACLVGVAVSVIPVGLLALGVFIKPLSAEFGWGRGQVALAVAILSLAMAAALPVAGRLIDRYGVRRPLLGSLVVYGLSVALVPAAIAALGLSGLYIGAAVIGGVGAASSSLAYVRIISAWFDKSRGLALGSAMSGIALGGAIAPLLASTFIERLGWQSGFYALAALPLLIGLPVAMFLPAQPVNETMPGTATVRPALIPSADPSLALADAARGRTFWLLMLTFLIVAGSINSIQVHLPALLSDYGLTAQDSVLALSFMFLISLVSRVVVGLLLDRVFAPIVGIACFLAAMGGCVLLIYLPSYYLISAGLLGLGAGAEADLLAFLVGRYFGLTSFGVIYGWIFAAFMGGSAIGPFMAGASFDSTGGYKSALIASAIGIAMASALLVLLPRYRSELATAH